MTDVEILVIILMACLGIFNIGLTLLNFKLYTEFFKQILQYRRSDLNYSKYTPAERIKREA